MAKKIKKVKITQIKSCIGQQETHRRTIRALGFKKLNQTLIKDATPQVLGMINKVIFMLKVEETEK